MYLKYEVSVGKSKSTEMDSVFPSVKVSEIVELFGRYFQIGIYEKNLEASTLEETMNKKKSAFAVLLENRERMTLPQRPSNNNKRDALTIMITDWLEEIELGISPDAVNTIGIFFITVVSNTLWYIDPFVETMDDRSCTVPQALNRFFGLNNPKLRKQKVQPVESPKLLEHATNIDTLLELPFMHSERWKAVKTL